MNVSLVCLFRGVNLWNIPATMIIFQVNKWILLYYNVVNMNFHYWMIIVAEMFHKLKPRNRQTSETFIQFVCFFIALFHASTGHYFDPKLTAVHIFYATSILCFFRRNCIFPSSICQVCHKNWPWRSRNNKTFFCNFLGTDYISKQIFIFSLPT